MVRSSGNDGEMDLEDAIEVALGRGPETQVVVAASGVIATNWAL